MRNFAYAMLWIILILCILGGLITILVGAVLMSYPILLAGAGAISLGLWTACIIWLHEMTV